MFANVFKAQKDLAPLILRLGLAAIFIVHGYIKVIQVVPLFPGRMSMEVQEVVGWGELVCGVALLFGLLTRLAAAGIVALQIGAIIQITGKLALAGPVMERTGADYTRVGPEYNLALIAMALSLVVIGGGALALDHCIASVWSRNKTAPSAPPSPAIPRLG
jgi:putative oxidoreductase